ncbi:ADP-ribose pyrophosphatase YjhB (NUDIX family) [Murinocardiopsis flavida]|uniref:ADP-ribose pyrophosphatase YjhB (NUDIX family) n=1 Tax=Murinocardiopsis flavida TaxID=645275 RepID=A0A2P8DQA3_9ACTN|nr:NUDIX hydrolase [Murinocardiopsis flavida]PSK99368.1 ADP-ribose pyrophosphatase YjhB (NUDIX family) [Murinocardiopsis flavida]
MIRGDGDGWVELADGTRRWGLFGAAGLLLHAADAAGTGHVLLQHRALWSHMGGTWGVPGGARDSGESSLQAALREFGEEVAGPLDGALPSAVHRQDHTVWTYDTVFAQLPELRAYSRGNTESAEIRWVPVEKVPSLKLLPAFAATWPLLLSALDRRLVLVVDARGTTRDPAPLRDALAEAARTGIESALLPQVPRLMALHRWFPRVRLLVPRPGLAPAPGVEVAAGDAAPGPPAPEGTAELVLTDDPDLRAAHTERGAVGAPLGLLDTLIGAPRP